MVEQCKKLNITYAPIMENYPQFDNIPRVPNDQINYDLIAETMETGGFQNLINLILIFQFLALEVCQKPCYEVNIKMSKDTFHHKSPKQSVLIVSFDRKWVFERVNFPFIKISLIPKNF